MEAMHTHGLSKPFAYNNSRRVVRAINYEDLPNQFRKKSDFNLFQYSVGRIDGLAIQTKTPSRNKYKNMTRFMSGTRKYLIKHASNMWAKFRYLSGIMEACRIY